MKEVCSKIKVGGGFAKVAMLKMLGASVVLQQAYRYSLNYYRLNDLQRYLGVESSMRAGEWDSCACKKMPLFFLAND